MHFLSIAFLLLFLQAIFAQSFAGQEANQHTIRWENFVEKLQDFFEQHVDRPNVEISQKIGGYYHLPDFYLQRDYHHEGKLIATVQWEREAPENLHTIEVYVHDEQGRVVRDYIAAYLPNYRTAATQALISLHSYTDGLHAFRTFDASGYRVTERCTGTYNGKQVEILLDEDEIAEALDEAHVNQGIMTTKDYRACFGDLQQEVGEYITPN